MVGAILANDTCIARGFHERPGLPHAEVQALKNIEMVPENATLYVTLEPCCSYGRTPPCSELILKKNIRRVVVGMLDPDPRMAGRGIEILRKADAVYIDQIRKHGLYNDIWQAFVAILPVRTVGVMGDGRTYDYACTLRAVTSVDGMTADYYPFSHEFLSETATRLINEVDGINRVTYDITSKPPGTIEWE